MFANYFYKNRGLPSVLITAMALHKLSNLTPALTANYVNELPRLASIFGHPEPGRFASVEKTGYL